MNTKNENEKPAEAREVREARIPPSLAEPFEPEAAAQNDGSDFREMPERGYGWGV